MFILLLSITSFPVMSACWVSTSGNYCTRQVPGS